MNSLLEALGPAMDDLVRVSFDPEATAWTLAFDDDALLLEWDADLDCLMVQALLGNPPEHAQLAAYRAALAFNGSWRHQGNARIAMVDADGDLALMVELPATGLTTQTLLSVLTGFRSMVQAWRQVVMGVPGEVTVESDAAPFAFKV
ncbi:MAG: type III secretion system chaperone [Hydrogenophaga sp.]|nr:type III secretion system chaperone [Hydrogenophaga sp.]